MKAKTHRENMKTYGKKVKGLIRSIANNSDSYDEQYMIIKFDSDDDLPSKKMLELHNMVTNTICKFS